MKRIFVRVGLAFGLFVAGVSVIVPFSAQAQQCTNYFQSMKDAMRKNLGICAQRNVLMEGFVQQADLPTYAPGSPGAPTDRPGRTYPNTTGWADAAYNARSDPNFKAILPGRSDARWRLDGDQVIFNCTVPLSPNAMPQNEAFLECARVYSCGARAAHCGIERARTTNTNNCAAISQTCLNDYPVPQGVALPPGADPRAPNPNAPSSGSAQAPVPSNCPQLVNSYVTAAQANDGPRALAGYNALKSAGGCGVLDQVDSGLPAAGGSVADGNIIARPQKQNLGAIEACHADPAGCAQAVEQLKAGTAPDQQAQMVMHAITTGLQLGAAMANGLAIASTPRVGGNTGGQSRGGTDYRSLAAPPIRHGVGQGSGATPQRNIPSDITGTK